MLYRQVLVCPVSASEATLSLAFTLTPKAQFDQAGAAWPPAAAKIGAMAGGFMVQDGAPKIAKLPCKWLNSMVYGRYNYSIPVVPHKAVAEVSKIGNL